MRPLRALLACALVPALLAAAPAEARTTRVHKLRVTSHADPQRAFPKRRVRRIARGAALPALAGAWGCTEASTDRAPLLSNAPQVKLVYAYPSGATNQTSTFADQMQADAAALEQRVDVESNHTKTIRFDVGGTGGVCTADSSNRLDIQTVQLQNDASYYDSADTFHLLESELEKRLVPAFPHQRVNYVVYTDGITGGAAAGQADLPADSAHGYANSINQGYDGDGRLFAFVYSGSPSAAARQEVFLHELSHTLGAVQNSAPHSSGAGHCFDEWDVMCYDDDGPYFQQGGQRTFGCAGTEFTDEKFDCGQDDYWNPSPAPGSYLATNWNEYDSVFLCAVADCDRNLNDPSFAVTLSATHANGQLTLSANAGSAAIEHYEWNVNGDGAYETDTGSTPTLVPHFSFPRSGQVEVRAVKADGTFAYASMPLTPTQPKPALKVAGDLQPGATLTLDGTGTADPDGLVKRYLWDTDNDGSLETDSGLTPTVTTSYATAGPKQATLEVDFGYGWASTTVGFQIAAPQPPAPDQPVIPVVKPPTLGAANVRLRRLLSKGLQLRLTCFSPCSLSATLSVDAKTARKLHLRSKVIGRVVGKFAAGTVTPTLRLRPTAARALRRARSLKASLHASVSAVRVQTLTITKPLVFKR